jgi:hypothetical protein
MKCLNVCKNKGTLLSSFLLLLLTQQNFILIQADTAEIKIKNIFKEEQHNIFCFLSSSKEIKLLATPTSNYYYFAQAKLHL